MGFSLQERILKILERKQKVFIFFFSLMASQPIVIKGENDEFSLV
jgi:hypothetical protein